MPPTDPEVIARVQRDYYLGPLPRPTLAALAEREGLSVSTVRALVKGRHLDGSAHQAAQAALEGLGLGVDNLGRVVSLEVPATAGGL